VGALLAVAGLAAATVHFKVVPLDVLAVWTRPVRLELTSQPPTAEIYVDGTRLPRRTPTTIELPRDRSPHEIEMRRDGFRPARTTVRLDRSAADALPVGLVLEKETRPAVRPLPGVRPDPRRGR
jgi:hypothetical protein